MRLRKLLAASAAAAVFGLGTMAAADEPETVRYAAFPCTHCAAGWLMPEFGEKFGVKIELERLTRYADVQVALATGEVDFGNFGFINGPMMADQGIDNVRIVAGVSEGGQGITLRQDVEVESWEDLEGLRLGSPPNSLVENLFKSSMAYHGADPMAVEYESFRTMGPEVLQSLERGRLDGFLGWEPTQAVAVAGGYGKYAPIRIEDGPIGNPNGALGVTTEFLEEHPETALKVMQAHVAATEYLKENPDAWLDVVIRTTGTEPDVAELAMENSILTYEMSLSRVEGLASLLGDVGLTRADHSERMSEILDYSLLSEATGKSPEELGMK